MNDKVSVSYQLAAEGGGGIISARDFVNLRYCDVRDGIYVCSGRQLLSFVQLKSKTFVLMNGFV